MSIRKHYMTLFTRNKQGDVITYKPNKDGLIEVMVETPIKTGFKSIVIDENCRILDVDGFNAEDIEFYRQFVANNIGFIKELSLRR